MRQREVKQLGLLDGLAAKVPGNEFLERLETLVDWAPWRRELEALFTATTGRLPRPPLVVFKMPLLRHCHGLSDPQCEELVGDRLSWRRFVGLGLVEPVPDETTLERFRQRLVQAARRAPGKGSGGDPEADHTVKHGQPHYGFKARVAVDEEHTLIRRAELSAASEHDSRRLEHVVTGDEKMVVADKAYWSRDRGAWLDERDIQNGILRRGSRNHPLGEPAQKINRFLSGVRARIEGVFGHWKRSLGYRRVRYLGLLRNRLELEFRCVVWNLRRWVNLAATA